ncbi:P-loop containing nucleoside triphosphate hydrolase protein [Trichoderma sp. SZMC 28012]
MESSKTPQPSPTSTRYLSPPASCPAQQRVTPEISSLGDPSGTFQWSEDRFSDHEVQEHCDDSRSNASRSENMESTGDDSLFVEEQAAEENEKSLYIAENEAAGPKADAAQQGDVVEQNVASVLALELSEDSDLSDPPDDLSSDESDGSEYEDEIDSSSEKDEDEADGQAKSALANEEKIKKPRRKIAMNAREYVARLHEEEDRRYAKQMKRAKGKKPGAKRTRKRKATENHSGSRKTLKLADGSSVPIVDDGSSTADGNSLLPMEPIKAKTHADQFAKLKIAQLKAQIPQNFDTRRRNTQSQDLHEAASLFGYKRVEADDGRWKLKGMEASLEGHQLTVAAWMVKRELAREKPFGGLLADAPGMGKTVMSLACIVGNQADDEHLKNFCNATLVVVRNKTDGKQWEREKHLKAPFKDHVFIYDSNHPELEKKCKRSYIVITTYSELIAQYPNNRVLAEWREKYDSDDISFRRAFDSHAGLMFKINWYRIILDEAHAIKNVNGRTSKACCALLGKYRWALTGTPLANSSDEMYPYMKFTQCESTYNSKEFKSVYTIYSNPNAKFETATSHLMYRSAVKKYYEKQTTSLHQGTLGQHELEAEIDDALDDVEKDEDENKGQKKSKAAKESSESMRSSMGYASQVRKRQAISHAFCLERFLRHSLKPEDLRELMGALEKVSMKQTILQQIRANVEKDCGTLKYEVGLQQLEQRKEAMFGKYFDMKTLLNLTMGESLLRGGVCLLCQKPPAEPTYAEGCGHVFCSKCLCRAIKVNLRGGQKINCPHESCSEELACGEDIETLQGKIEPIKKSYREPGRDNNNMAVHIDDDKNSFFVCSTILDDAPIVPSTRLTAIMAIVLTWLHEAPDDKIILFTQFKGTAKILGYMLETLDIGFVFYYGSIPPKQRDKALTAFGENADVKVMVSTLGSSRECLNLTMANRAILIDPWWNKTAEQQAFGRIHRIGQVKKTYKVTIRTDEEIDNRIRSLQLKKAADVDYTLQDDGHTPPSPAEIERQRDFFGRQEKQEERQKNKKVNSKAGKAGKAGKVGKKSAAKASPKKNN